MAGFEELGGIRPETPDQQVERIWRGLGQVRLLICWMPCGKVMDKNVDWDSAQSKKRGVNKK